MNCLPNISIALSLLSLTGGVWFLYKTQKENLNILFKVAAWSIIIVSLLNMACCGMRCMMRGCGERNNCRTNNYMRGGDYERGRHGSDRWNGEDYRYENYRNRDKDCREKECDEEDNYADGKCCDKENETCKIKKDSVVIIKK